MCRRTGWKKEANAGEGGNDGETGKIWNTAQCCTSTAAGSNCEGGKAWGAPKYGESSRYMWLEACPRLPCTKVRTQNARNWNGTTDPSIARPPSSPSVAGFRQGLHTGLKHLSRGRPAFYQDASLVGRCVAASTSLVRVGPRV